MDTDRTFKIGTTSYIYPAGMAENVRKLKDRAEDIELLFLESDNLPGPGEISILKETGRAAGITYTVHLPLDLDVSDPDRAGREKAVAGMAAAVKTAVPLDPAGYILHLYNSRSVIDEKRRRAAALSLEEIISACGGDQGKIFLENQWHHPGLIEGFTSGSGPFFCLDTGHLQQQGIDVRECFCRYIERTRVIHMYSVDDEGRHAGIKSRDMELAEWVIRFAEEKKFGGILTLEVFSESDYEGSLAVLKLSAGRRR
ncbi:MAG: sugar phosphate isomerase/epimerase [Elusimicrobia bacterium]|nr:sugar phosphate isomerase/epimerase [Elusimicrobiota bacterium]